MRVRLSSVVLVILIFAGGALVAADDGEPVVAYLDAEGTAPVGLLGAGVDGVDLASFSFVPNATHPRLQLLLDYSPTEVSAGAGRVSATLAYEFRLDVADALTNETVVAYNFTSPGQRYHLLNATLVDGRAYLVDLYLHVGFDVDWQLAVRGWRAPVPI